MLENTPPETICTPRSERLPSGNLEGLGVQIASGGVFSNTPLLSAVYYYNIFERHCNSQPFIILRMSNQIFPCLFVWCRPSHMCNNFVYFSRQIKYVPSPIVHLIFVCVLCITTNDFPYLSRTKYLRPKFPPIASRSPSLSEPKHFLSTGISFSSVLLLLGRNISSLLFPV